MFNLIQEYESPIKNAIMNNFRFYKLAIFFEQHKIVGKVQSKITVCIKIA